MHEGIPIYTDCGKMKFIETDVNFTLHSLNDFVYAWEFILFPTRLENLPCSKF